MSLVNLELISYLAPFPLDPQSDPFYNLDILQIYSD